MPPSLDALTRRILQRHVTEASARPDQIPAALALMFPCGWSLIHSHRASLYAISGIATPRAEPVQAHGTTPSKALENIHAAFVARYL